MAEFAVKQPSEHYKGKLLSYLLRGDADESSIFLRA
jgi:hypothetical protein